MTVRAEKDIFWDLNRAAIVNNSTGTTTSALPAPTLYLRNEYTFNITLYQEWPERWDLSAATTFKQGIGNIGSTSNPLVESNNASITSTSKASGEFAVIVNTWSSTLDADLGDAEVKQYTIELVADEDSTIMQTPCYIRNVVYTE